MKKLIALGLFFAFSTAIYAQQEVPAKKAVKQEVTKGTDKAATKAEKEATKVTEKAKVKEMKMNKEAEATKKDATAKVEKVKADVKKSK
ncbi:hypothetical protein [Flavobacterium sp. '19STA2R22 D10 B1']|uniref:hypothetical protein n=1 Tax=Flavobacterium aerium TaxID=3037261 RepID=UPI00278BE095|nr:hypothetical protein [Flavobacterium sp. '19STA2R22 D10 B1']